MIPSVSLPARPARFILPIILLWGGWLRLGWPGINSFSFDEARVSQLALAMARGGDFAELGMQSSTGVPNFPGAVWLYTLPYAISADPLWATLLTGLVSTLAILGIWWLARESWGEWAAAACALVFATAPYVIFYSRNIWAQNWLPPLAILWGWSAAYGLSRQKGWPLALHAFLAGFAAQVHYAGLVLAFGSLFLGFRFRLWRRWRPVTAGILLALLAAAPTLWTIWRFGDGARAELAAALGRPATTDWGNFSRLADLVTGRGWDDLWLNAAWRWPPLIELGLAAGQWLIGLLAAGGFLTILWNSWRERGAGSEDPPAVRAVLSSLIPIWLFVSPLFFLRSATPSFLQYMLPSLPAGILSLGVIFDRRRGGRSAIPLLLLLAGVALIQTAAVGRTLSHSARKLVPGGMGTPLLYPRAAAAELRGEERPVVIHAVGDAIEFDGDAAVFHVLFWGYPHQIVDGRSVLLLPAGGGTLLATFDDVPAWERLRAGGFEGEIRQLPRRTNEPPYMAFTAAGWSPTGMLPYNGQDDRGRLANGAALQGYRIEELPEGRLRLTTHWWIQGEPESGRFQQFNHLYTTGSGDRPAQVSDVTTSSQAWRVGDQLLIWAEFDPPPAGESVTHFDVGMYRWPSLERSPVLDRSGDPLAPLRLPWPPQ